MVYYFRDGFAFVETADPAEPTLRFPPLPECIINNEEVFNHAVSSEQTLIIALVSTFQDKIVNFIRCNLYDSSNKYNPVISIVFK